MFELNDKTIQEVKSVLECISDNMFSSPNIGIGYKGLFIQGHELFSSAVNSLRVIDFCISHSNYSDAYSILRKVRDDLFQGLFLYRNLRKVDVIDKNLTDDKIQELINVSSKKLGKLPITEKKLAATYASEAWLYNDITQKENKDIKDSFLGYNKYITYLTNVDNRLEELKSLYFKNKLEKLSRKLNNYVHGNGCIYAKNNYSLIDTKMIRQEYLDDLCDVVSILLAFLAVIDSTTLRSVDALDALENGYEPNQNDLSSIAPVIKDFMIRNLDESVMIYIQNNQDYNMNIYEKG